MTITAPAGLRDVVVTSTEVGDVRGAEGFYHYRQYSAIDLARTRTFEDVWFLFVEGRLPDAAEAVAFAAEIAHLRHIPDDLRTVLPAIARAGREYRPLTALRSALSVASAPPSLTPMWGRVTRRHGGPTRCGSPR